MAFVDALLAARADENIFVVIGHPDDFMRNDLADGQNQIVFAGPDEVGQLRRPRIIHGTLRHLLNKLTRHFADGGDARAPVVDAEKAFRHTGEHLADLRRSHRRVRAKRGQNVRQTRSVVIVNELRQRSRVRMEAGEIRRNDQHPLARAEAVQGLKQTLAQVVQRQPVGYGTTFKIQHKPTSAYTTQIVAANSISPIETPGGFKSACVRSSRKLLEFSKNLAETRRDFPKNRPVSQFKT